MASGSNGTAAATAALEALATQFLSQDNSTDLTTADIDQIHVLKNGVRLRRASTVDVYTIEIVFKSNVTVDLVAKTAEIFNAAVSSGTISFSATVNGQTATGAATTVVVVTAAPTRTPTVAPTKSPTKALVAAEPTTAPTAPAAPTVPTGAPTATATVTVPTGAPTVFNYTSLLAPASRAVSSAVLTAAALGGCIMLA